MACMCHTQQRVTNQIYSPWSAYCSCTALVCVIARMCLWYVALTWFPHHPFSVFVPFVFMASGASTRRCMMLKGLGSVWTSSSLVCAFPCACSVCTSRFACLGVWLRTLLSVASSVSLTPRHCACSPVVSRGTFDLGPCSPSPGRAGCPGDACCWA
jgi:hypothetical protein